MKSNNVIALTNDSVPTRLSMTALQSAVWDKIMKIDLEPICYKIVNCDEGGEPWAREKVSRVENEYRQYLFLTVVEGVDKSIVPTLDIDHFWHTHILDTAKYAQDCEVTFGRFLHHFPYLGMRGEQDKQNLINSFEDTIVLFDKYFGVVPKNSSGAGVACAAGDCGGCDHRGTDNHEIAICGDALDKSRPRFQATA